MTRLFGAPAIAAHTVLFTPLVGAGLAALNWRRLGDPRRANKTLLMGVGACALMVVLAALLPESWDAAARGGCIGVTIALAMALHKEQQPLVARHVEAGGALASWIPATVVGTLGLAAIVAAMVLGVIATEDTRFDRGVAAFQADRLNQAESLFAAVVADDPDNDEARFNLALCHVREGDLDEAMRELRRIHDASPIAARARSLLGELER